MALGVWFDNFSSPSEITSKIFCTKIDKAKNWANVWSNRDLTVLGKVTIIKNLILSQFSYLAVPLLSPNINTIKSIKTAIYNFLWGGKRDKISRDIISRPKTEEGLGLFRIENFLSSLKLTILSKLLNKNFHHSWKDILKKQLHFPDHPIISFENNLLVNTNRSNIFLDLINKFYRWKLSSVNGNNDAVNPVIWKKQ